MQWQLLGSVNPGFVTFMLHVYVNGIPSVLFGRRLLTENGEDMVKLSHKLVGLYSSGDEFQSNYYEYAEFKKTYSESYWCVFCGPF